MDNIEIDTSDTHLLKAIEFLHKNRLIILMSFSAVLLLLSILYFKTPSDEIQRTRFLNAQTTYANWEGDPLNPLKEEKMLLSLGKFPELSTKYDYLIAQKYLILNEPTKARKFAKKAIARLEKNSPEFAKFSLSSLHISESSLTEALSCAIDLKKEINPTLTPTLFALNLLHIADLQRRLGLRDEQETILELENYLAGSSPIIFQKALSDNDITLIDYLNYRKQASTL